MPTTLENWGVVCKNLLFRVGQLIVVCLEKFSITSDIETEIKVSLKSKNSVFSSTGRRPASLCHGPLCVCVSGRASVRALTFSLNIFSETTHRILMKFHRNVPGIVLFRIS